jgi:lipid A 3-O-deacylase
MKKLLLAFVIALGASLAHADLTPGTAFVAEAGLAAHGTTSFTAGVSWPLAWRRTSRTGEWSAAIELFVSHWSAKLDARSESFTQLGLVPVARYRFDHGQSDWFAEGGVGPSYMNRLYERDHKQFSTRFNFYNTVGVGRSFGEHRENELTLRLVHISNAGIKEPNPGENFVQLRYARQF